MIYYAAVSQTSEDNRLIFRKKRIRIERNGLYVWGIVDISFTGSFLRGFDVRALIALSGYLSHIVAPSPAQDGALTTYSTSRRYQYCSFHSFNFIKFARYSVYAELYRRLFKTALSFPLGPRAPILIPGIHGLSRRRRWTFEHRPFINFLAFYPRPISYPRPRAFGS